MAIWPWLLLALLALLLLWYVMRRKRAIPAATPRADDAPVPGGVSVPLAIEFPDLGVSFPLKPGTMILGSGPASDIRLDGPDIREAHAEFCTGEECELRKLERSYGVKLNGREIEKAVSLKPGDTLTIGNTRAVIGLREEE